MSTIENASKSSKISKIEYTNNMDPKDLSKDKYQRVKALLDSTRTRSRATKRTVGSFIAEKNPFNVDGKIGNYMFIRETNYNPWLDTTPDIVRDGEVITFCTTIHAEEAVLAALNFELANDEPSLVRRLQNDGLILFVSHIPCWNCAKQIALNHYIHEIHVVLDSKEYTDEDIERYMSKTNHIRMDRFFTGIGKTFKIVKV